MEQVKSQAEDDRKRALAQQASRQKAFVERQEQHKLQKLQRMEDRQARIAAKAVAKEAAKAVAKEASKAVAKEANAPREPQVQPDEL
jgi:hypothetical protein